MIKRYKQFNESHKDIDAICVDYEIRNYTINDDGSIDVNGSVDLSGLRFAQLPLRFRNVSGNFECYDNKLITLEGCPITVGGNFTCYDNKLTSLEGCPISIGGYFSCYDNKLVSLKGSPQSVGSFNCNDNKLTSLEGCPITVGGNFTCRNNKLKSLEYISDYKGNLSFDNNPIFKWWDMVKVKSKTNFELFKEFNIHADDPDEINKEKINMINNG